MELEWEWNYGRIPMHACACLQGQCPRYKAITVCCFSASDMAGIPGVSDENMHATTHGSTTTRISPRPYQDNHGIQDNQDKILISAAQ